MPSFRALIEPVVAGGATLTMEQARGAVEQMLEGEVSDAEIASLLTAIAARGETADELAGFVQAMRSLGRPLPLRELERKELVDTCGTGGDDRGTFNISTGAALVAAAAGARVAKHGNRGVTSKCGSADVLEALEIPADLDPETAVACLRATGFMFLYAPLLHPSLKRVQPVRRALGFRTIFNLAGPLTNPAGANAQVMGVFSLDRLAVVSAAMTRLGTRHALVVHGSGGLDEIALEGPSHVAEVRDGTIRLLEIEAKDAGLEPAPLSDLAGGDAECNARILEDILRGQPGPRRDVVVLNAAAALIVTGIASDFAHGVSLASHAIDGGAGTRLLESLRAFKTSPYKTSP